MWENILSKIKKYLFLISILFFVVTWAHLIYLYLYSDAEEIPVEWGTISEAIIGTMPHLNPLLPSSDYNKYINSILYRSLLTYDIKNNKITSDIASCDTSNLIFIECYLENNITWSNGTPITEDDIIATLNLIEKTNVNPGISALLENTTIEKWNGKITFNNIKKDINFLNILFQPIIPKSVIEVLSETQLKGNFSPIEWIYSWKYILSSVNQDETVGITKMTLSKNEKYFQNDAFIDTIILKIFKDNNHFLKHKNSFNVFNDKDNLLWNSIPRLESFEYTLPRFVGLFLNSNSLESTTVRTSILNNIHREALYTALWTEKVSPALNPFLSDRDIDNNSELPSLSELAQKAWYFSKIDLMKKSLNIQKLEEQEQEKISDEAIPLPKKKSQSDLSYITSPTNQKYNFVSEDNILLSGKVDEGIEAVYVNDYKLQGFSAGDEVFHYRLLESYDSIVPWENTYQIFFESNAEKKLVEEVVYIYETDNEKLQATQDNFFDEAPVEIPEEPSNIIATENKNTQTGSGDILETDEDENDTLTIDSFSLENLDDRFYYTTDGDAFKMKLVYVNSDENIQKTAQYIKEDLEKAWMFVELIPLSLVDVTRWLRDNSLEYDAILIGLNLWYFHSNIFPYFHSSQVKNGYNFSNYKQLGLDILLEELKSNNLSKTKKGELEDKVLDILQDASIVKTFYTPKTRLLIDKNLQWFDLGDFLPDEVHRFAPLLQTYIAKKKILSTQEKGFFEFWKFVFTSFL